MLDFIKKNPGILSSLVLVVLVPALIYANVFFIISVFQEHIDDGLHLKATLAQTIFGILASGIVDNPEILQEKIEEIKKMEGGEAIVNLQIIAPEDREFKIIAAKNKEDIGTTVTKDATVIMPWYQRRPFANLREEEGKRVWYVVDSFYDDQGERAGLISLTLSLEQTDALIHRTVWKSYLILFGTVLIVLLLVAHHTKLFGYVVLYNKLKEADRMKDSFIRIATHELQSPIINIRGHLEILEEEISSSLTEDQREIFRRAKVSGKNLSELIYDILEVSRIEQGRLDFTPQKICPQKLITEVIQDLNSKAEEKNLTLLPSLEAESYFIKANSNRLRQVLTNLLENAIKYTPQGKVWIRTKVDESKGKERYIIEIEDTGIGIAAEDQERLFERFYRIKIKETAEIPGTGLGLWISKQICEKMGGKIFVESMKGVGTKFTLVFPLIKE